MSSLPCKGVTKNGNYCPVLISLKKIEEQTKLSQQCFPKAGFIDFQYCKKHEGQAPPIFPDGKIPSGYTI